ncbi:hypothetical protein D3C76_1548990 [compost metagenome]
MMCASTSPVSVLIRPTRAYTKNTPAAIRMIGTIIGSSRMICSVRTTFKLELLMA